MLVSIFINSFIFIDSLPRQISVSATYARQETSIKICDIKWHIYASIVAFVFRRHCSYFQILGNAIHSGVAFSYFNVCMLCLILSMASAYKAREQNVPKPRKARI